MISGGMIMNLGLIFKETLNKQGRTIAWLSDKLDLHEKTLAGKLNRNSITGEEVLLITTLLGIDIRELQKTYYKQKFETGGNFMSVEKVMEVINRFKTEGIDLTNKQKNYIDEFYEVGCNDVKYIYNEAAKEVYIWCSTEAFEELSRCEFYLDEDESSLYIKMEDEVIAGYKDYDNSINFIEMLIQAQNDEAIGEDGNYIEKE
jgi:lambda repressor-like predicted transcriptional regulator